MPLLHHFRPAPAELRHRTAPAMLGLGLSLLLAGCGDSRVLGDDAEDPPADSESTDTDDPGHTVPDPEPETGSTDDGGSSETGEPEPTCACVDLDLVCGDLEGVATFDCALPNPCGLLDDEGDDPDTVACILDLLIAQEPARFQYRFQNSIDGGWEVRTWSGWFHILEPGVGLDNECYLRMVDFSGSSTPSANHYTLAEPSVFEECAEMDADDMRACLLGLLEVGEPANECE